MSVKKTDAFAYLGAARTWREVIAVSVTTATHMPQMAASVQTWTSAVRQGCVTTAHASMLTAPSSVCVSLATHSLHREKPVLVSCCLAQLLASSTLSCLMTMHNRRYKGRKRKFPYYPAQVDKS